MNNISIQVKYLYHGVCAADAESVLRYGLLTRNSRIGRDIKSSAHNLLACNDGIYVSDFMAIPFAWGIGKGLQEQKPGIIVRIPIIELSHKAFRPSQYSLVHYLRKIKHAEFINDLKQKQHLEQNKEQWLAWQFHCVTRYLDEYAFLWEASLLEAGEIIYKENIDPHQFRAVGVARVDVGFANFDRTQTQKIRAAHTEKLQQIFACEDGGN